MASLMMISVLLLDTLSRVSTLNGLLRPTRLLLHLLGELRKIIPSLIRRILLLLHHNRRCSLILLLCPRSQISMLLDLVR